MSLMAALSLAAGLSDPAIEVTVDPAIDDAEQLSEWVKREGAEAAANREPEEEWSIVVNVGGATYDYQVEFTLERDGILLDEQPDPIKCECTNEQLIEEVAASFELCLDMLEEEEDDGGGTPEKPTGPKPNGGTPTDKVPLQAMGKAGIALIAVGAVSLGVGIGLVVAGERQDATPWEGEQNDLNFKPPGYVLLGIGGAALAAGIGLLVADRVKARKKKTTFLPVVAPAFAGFTLKGQF